MTNDDLARQLHVRATRGEVLSSAGQMHLDAWYARQYEAEAKVQAEREREVIRMEYPHIIRTPDTCGGLPRIEGTRITVNFIAREVVRLRHTPEEVLMAHSHLTLAQIHAALAYYFDHREEIDTSLRVADDLETDLRAQFPSRLQRVPSS